MKKIISIVSLALICVLQTAMAQPAALPPGWPVKMTLPEDFKTGPNDTVENKKRKIRFTLIKSPLEKDPASRFTAQMSKLLAKRGHVLTDEATTIDGHQAKLILLEENVGGGGVLSRWYMGLDNGRDQIIIVAMFGSSNDADYVKGLLRTTHLTALSTDPFVGSKYRFEVSPPFVAGPSAPGVLTFANSNLAAEATMMMLTLSRSAAGVESISEKNAPAMLQNLLNSNQKKKVTITTSHAVSKNGFSGIEAVGSVIEGAKKSAFFARIMNTPTDVIALVGSADAAQASRYWPAFAKAMATLGPN